MGGISGVSGRDKSPGRGGKDFGAKMAVILEFVSIRTFLRLLGFVYFYCLFYRSASRRTGLIGSHGILPYASFLKTFHRAVRRRGVSLCANDIVAVPDGPGAGAVLDRPAVLAALLALVGKWHGRRWRCAW